MPREVRQVLRLALRQPAAAQGRHVGRGDFRRRKAPELVRRRIVRHIDKTPPDRVGRLDRYLLADDRPGERREWIGAALQMDAGISADQPAQDAIAARQLARGLVPEWRLHRRRRLARRGPASRRRGRDGHARRPRPRRNGRRAGAGSGTLRAFRRRGIDGPSVSAGHRRRGLPAGAVRRPRANRVGGRGSEQGAARRHRSRRRRLRSVAEHQLLFRADRRGHFRATPHLRLPRRAGQARADAGRSDARSRRRRQDVYVPSAQGRLFYPRPCVQERQARARRRRRRLLDQALPRSEESLAVAISVRRQDRRPERAGSAGEKERRPVRLRRQDSRTRSRRSLHDPLSSDRHRLQLRLHTGVADEQHRRARSHRALRRRHQGAPGRLRAVHAGASGSEARASCCTPTPDIAASSGISSRRPIRGTRTSSRR